MRSARREKRCYFVKTLAQLDAGSRLSGRVHDGGSLGFQPWRRHADELQETNDASQIVTVQSLRSRCEVTHR
jgi:hypothetical protein